MAAMLISYDAHVCCQQPIKDDAVICSYQQFMQIAMQLPLFTGADKQSGHSLNHHNVHVSNSHCPTKYVHLQI